METAKRSGDENDKIRWKKKERHVTTHSNHRKSHKMSVQFNCRCQTVTIPSQFGCGEANGKNDESFRAACDAVLRVDSCFVFVRLEKLGRNKKNSVRPKEREAVKRGNDGVFSDFSSFRLKRRKMLMRRDRGRGRSRELGGNKNESSENESTRRHLENVAKERKLARSHKTLMKLGVTIQER